MAELQVHGDTVTIALSIAEKIEALHPDVTIPRSAITGAREVPDGLEEVHGLRMPGTGFPGVILVGTFREPDRTTFAVCHGQRPAIVLDVAGQPYDRIVVTVDAPDAALAALG
ncbi:hypothetical protein [Pseudactinotalea sp. HY158]|uniref:hypothetical protein n=1 Tax=Pseudactinotalea sp. HY158 TaxID=2654547 RepID=UPI00129CB165|nr:hypothetical protein [Pseudactinotalea sp. HY158]QGH69807.1 hypothetical protein GCE65_10030 [Pseudactinotalea sp. HY158]